MKKLLVIGAHGLVIAGMVMMYQCDANAQVHTGTHNVITGLNASVTAGDFNTNADDYSVIAGGDQNMISTTGENDQFIGGGIGNLIVGGGAFNGFAVIVGGAANFVEGGWGEFLGGGFNNVISNDLGQGFSTIAGGEENIITSDFATIGGGYENSAGISADGNGYGTIAGGYYNTNNGYVATIGGGGHNLAEGYYSTIPGGVGAKTTVYGQQSHASGSFIANSTFVLGSAQVSEYTLFNQTTVTNESPLFLDGNSDLLVMPANSTWSFEIMVSVRKANGDSGGFKANGVVKNVSGTITVQGGTLTVPAIVTPDVGTWKVTVSADSVHHAMAVHVFGDSSTNRWVAAVRTTEVTY